jgi:hypothetical protein
MSIRRWAWIIIAALVVINLLIQGWAALQGEANFNSDEAIMGLMALHSLEGRVPIYFYWQQYAGSLESLLAAGVIRIFGHGIWQLRVPSILFYTAFLILNLVLVRRMWGRRQALLSLLLLAIPTWSALFWFYRPTLGYSAMMTLGTGLFLLTDMQPASKLLNSGRLLLMGTLCGLALWVNPMSIVYGLAWSLIVVLGSYEWKRVYETLQGIKVKPHASAATALPAVVASIAGLGLLAFFSRGCTPMTTFAPVARVARLALFALALLTGLALLWASKERGGTILNALGFTGGTLIGSLPQLYAMVILEQSPSMAVVPSCPVDTLSRGKLIFLTLLPSLAGNTRPLPGIPNLSPPFAALSLSALALAGCALLVFLWSHRRGLRHLMGLVPISGQETRAIILVLWLGIPVSLALFGNNTVDLWSMRYLLITWHAGTIILAWFIDQLLKQGYRRLSYIALTLWLVQVVAVGYSHLQQEWQSSQLAAEAIQQLEDYLVKQDAPGGYADYWIAYTLDYLTQERLTLAAHNLDRYPSYTVEVAAWSRQAYVLQPGLIPEPEADLGSLIDCLRQNIWAGPADSEILAHLSRQTVVERQRVANWDVWIVSNSEEGN